MGGFYFTGMGLLTLDACIKDKGEKHSTSICIFLY